MSSRAALEVIMQELVKDCAKGKEYLKVEKYTDNTEKELAELLRDVISIAESCMSMLKKEEPVIPEVKRRKRKSKDETVNTSESPTIEFSPLPVPPDSPAEYVGIGSR